MKQLNPDQKDNLPDQIDEWLEQGVIEPSVSPWALHLIPVKKKDRRMRWVTDLRELNKQMVKDSHPLTNIQKIFHSLQGTTACTAFISPFGIFQYIYTNAVWISQRWNCLQQEAGSSHEGGGQGILDIMPG